MNLIWLRNCWKYERKNIIAEMANGRPLYAGWPKPTKTMTAEQLFKVGVVGIYGAKEEKKNE